MIDCHSHILPGMDDGARDLGTALRMAEMAERDGIRIMVATPHVLRNGKAPDIQALADGVSALQEAVTARGLSLRIIRGVELFVTHDLLAVLKRFRRDLRINAEKYVLIEFPPHFVFQGSRELFFEIMSEGSVPIIAHPERNSVFQDSPERLFDLVNSGALCQLNCGSLTGIYGKRVRETGLRFLKWRYIHMLGTDCHNTSTLPPIMSRAMEILSSEVEPSVLESLAELTPADVIAGRDLSRSSEPLPPTRGPGPRAGFRGSVLFRRKMGK